MSKQSMREEAERLVREAMAKKSVSVKKVETRVLAKCGKCGTENKVTLTAGESRGKFTCKECGKEQMTL
jgi:peptide subunit release factor 1 (eRF1)